MDDDAQLLQDYAKNRSEAAFAALTARYVGLVYSSCCRQLRDRHLAEDATQAVFVIVGQKAAAGSLRAATLAGWLLTTARYTCANVRRTELRRRRHETAVAMGGQSKAADEDLLALLDDGLARLRERDRQAIALRYLQGRPLRDVGAALGVSEEAAGKRVTRGVQKLRTYFAHRGIVTAPAMLAAVLEMQAAAGAAALDEAARTQLTLGILQACQGGAARALRHRSCRWQKERTP